MSILKRITNTAKETKSATVTSRLTPTEYRKFEDICKTTGYSVAEAIRLLVLNEINPEYKAPRPAVPAPKPVTSTVERKVDETVNTERIQKESHVHTPVYDYIPTTSHAKFTTEKWKVDGFLPCPICNEWASASNFSRHAKTTHGTTTREIFAKWEDKANRMVEARRG